MRRLILLAIALLFVAVTSAVAQDVRYDFDKDKDFSKYKTYKWVPIKDADQPNELTAKQITAAIDAELANKGLTKTESRFCRPLYRLSDRSRHGETVHGIQHGLGLRPRVGKRMVWIWWNGDDNDIRLHVYHLYWPARFEHVRCRSEATRVARNSLKDLGSQG